MVRSDPPLREPGTRAHPYTPLRFGQATLAGYRTHSCACQTFTCPLCPCAWMRGTWTSSSSHRRPASFLHSAMRCCGRGGFQTRPYGTSSWNLFRRDADGEGWSQYLPGPCDRCLWMVRSMSVSCAAVVRIVAYSHRCNRSSAVRGGGRGGFQTRPYGMGNVRSETRNVLNTGCKCEGTWTVTCLVRRLGFPGLRATVPGCPRCTGVCGPMPLRPGSRVHSNCAAKARCQQSPEGR